MTPTPRAAFVTGSGRNIGRAIALELGRRGMRVLVHGHTHPHSAEEVADAIRAGGGEAEVVLGDLGNPSAVEAMAARALQRFGTVDVLVNNAAIRPECPVESLSDADWHHVFQVNLHSAFALTRAFVPA